MLAMMGASSLLNNDCGFIRVIIVINRSTGCSITLVDDHESKRVTGVVWYYGMNMGTHLSV